jgi:drug/metabolite transporter (DMT)-like permease
MQRDPNRGSTSFPRHGKALIYTTGVFSQPVKPVRIKLWLAFAALGLVWGTTWVASDNLAEQVPPLLAAAVRFLLAALLLLPVILLKRLKLPRGRSLWIVLMLAAAMIALPFVLLLWARQHVDSATVTVSFAAMPLVVALLTPGAAGKAVPWRALQATIVALGAMVLATGASLRISQAAGAAVVLLAVASIGGSSLVARRELASLSPLVATAGLLGSAAPLLLLARLALERGQAAEWTGSAIGSVALLAVATAAAYPAYFWLLQQLEAYQLATVQWVQPLVAMAETAAFLRLRLSLSMIAGTVIALVCLWVVMRARPEDDDSVSLLGN